MDSRKVTLVATIAVIALVAVGVGYAYTAATQNTGNVVNPEYGVLTPSGYSAAFSKNIVWDTLNTSNEATGTSYTLNTTDNTITQANVDDDPADEYLVNLGTLTLTLNNTNMQGSDTYILKVKSNSALTGSFYAGVQYGGAETIHYFELSNTAGTEVAISDSQAKTVTTQTVTLYAVFDSNTTTTAPADKFNTTFTFTAYITQVPAA